MKLSKSDVLEATGGRWLGPEPNCDGFDRVSTDSRTLVPGSLFVALQGPHYDAHDYLRQAADRGACAAVVHRDAAHAPLPLIRVTDTLLALGHLGRRVRRALDLRVLAVTGSVGKTSTKEMAAAVLDDLGISAVVTPGNWNNRIGLPLTLLAARGTERVAILELGISEPGEMDHLSAICEPDAALITAVSECHSEGLGDITDIARQKLRIAVGLRGGGSLLVPAGDPLLDVPYPEAGRQKRTFGWTGGADLRGTAFCNLGSQGSRFRFADCDVHVSLPGRHNADNALAALAGLEAVGVPWRRGVGALRRLHAPPLRGEVRHLSNGIHLLVDCYNANPRAVGAALETLSDLAGRARTIAVLGEMKELGRETEQGHVQVGRAAARLGVSQLHLLGRHTAWVREAAASGGIDPGQIWMYEDREALAVALSRQLHPGDWVLIKGSRSLGMESVAEAVEQNVQRQKSSSSDPKRAAYSRETA